MKSTIKFPAANSIIYDWFLIFSFLIAFYFLSTWAVGEELNLQGPFLGPGNFDLKLNLPGYYAIYYEDSHDAKIRKYKLPDGVSCLLSKVDCYLESTERQPNKVIEAKNTLHRIGIGRGMPYTLSRGKQAGFGIPIAEFKIEKPGSYILKVFFSQSVERKLNLTVGPKYLVLLVNASLILLAIALSGILILRKKARVKANN